MYIKFKSTLLTKHFLTANGGLASHSRIAHSKWTRKRKIQAVLLWRANVPSFIATLLRPLSAVRIFTRMTLKTLLW
jgi:hypothetical protein